MNIFNDYLKNLNYILEQGNNRLQKGHSINPRGELFKELNDLFPEDQLLPSLEEFSSMTGMIPNFSQKLGSHPDFSSLKGNSSIENHYIVSMFIDIKGSTNLFKKYHPALVFYISNTIQKVAIHTSLIFGAYVQRLHGDGLFVYFGGKRITKEVAVQRALQCASVYSYFIKNDLKNLFNEAGIETIYTRIGIDLGHDLDVIWALAGIGEISEITTCSLHTSLASKMQNMAESNGIVIGENIFSISKEKDFFSSVSDRTNNSGDAFIFRNESENFFYKQYDFHWLNFLKAQDFIATDLAGNLRIKRKENLYKDIENLKPLIRDNRPYLPKNGS